MVVSIDKEEEFVELVSKSTGYVFVDYFAEWCGPCKRFSPTLNRLEAEWTDVEFYKVDIECIDDETIKHSSPVLKKTLDTIQSMPTFVLYLNGTEVGRVSGASETKVVELLSQSKS